MHKPLTALLAASLLVSGCNSRINPVNWFGGSRSAPVAAPEEVNPLIPTSGGGIFKRPEAEDVTVPIASVSELRIEPDLSGAIVTATGIAMRQGAYGAELRPTSEDLVPENGVLTFDFVVAYPEYRTATGSEQSRKVVVGYDLSRQELQGVRSIRVVGQNNALESRQR